MTFNKIPLALGFNSSTGNASGLVEFTFNLSDSGDVRSVAPGDSQVLSWNGTSWGPTTPGTGGGASVPAPNATGDLVQSTNGSTWSHIGSATFITNSNIVVDSDLTAYPTLAGNNTLAGDNTFQGANSFGITSTNIDTNGNLAIASDTTINGSTGDLSVGNTTITNSNGNVVVGGTLTVGDTVFTTDGDATLSNVDKNSLVITNSASSVSSLSGASGSIVYFEGTTPAPAFKTFAQILSNENYNISPGATYAASPTLQHIAGNPIASTNSTSKTALNTVSLPADTLASATTVRLTYNGTVNGNGGAVYFYLDKDPDGDSPLAFLESNSTFDSSTTDQAFTMIVEIIGVTTDRQRITQNFKSSTPTAAAAGVGGIGSVGKSGFAYVDTTLDDSSAQSITLSSKLASSSNGLVSIDEVLVEKIGPLA